MKFIHPPVKPYAAAILAPLRRFWNDTSGAVTVDWVALTAAVVAMVIAFMATFSNGVNDFMVVLLTRL